ncbi:hypothetical protein D3C75_1248540 [compost metagenome]
MNHRRVLAIDRRRAFDETQGAQGLVIDRGGRQALGEDRHELFLCRGRRMAYCNPRWLIVSSDQVS